MHFCKNFANKEAIERYRPKQPSMLTLGNSLDLLITDNYIDKSPISVHLREALKIRPRKCTCRYLWNYELHGLTAYIRSKTITQRIFWALILLICCSLSAFTTHWVFDEYLERQTSTLITIQQMQRNLGFRGQYMPIVVVCPKNPDALNYPLVLKDIAKRLPNLDRVTIANIIRFAIAGAGFDNIEKAWVSNLTSTEIQRLSSLLRRWQGHRTIKEFYIDLFEKHGYKCEELFQACFYGYEKIPCCDVFKSYYTDPDVYGRLNLYINQMPSRLVQQSGAQPQVVVYPTDNYADVATFPRYYIDFHESVHIRVKGRLLKMLPSNNQCSVNDQDKARASCFLRNWLRLRLVEPLNCTVYYLRHKHPNVPICRPETVVKNYNSIIDLRINTLNRGERCLPACERIEHTYSIFRSESFILGKLKSLPAFRMEISFTNLEMEKYQESRITSLPGFVSQLGGQSGLFVGLSICSIIQIVTSLIWKGYTNVNGYLNGANFRGMSSDWK